MTVQLICTFVFAYAKRRFSHDEAHYEILTKAKHGISLLCVQDYNTSSVYCCELAPGTDSLTCDSVRGDDSKQTSYYM